MKVNELIAELQKHGSSLETRVHKDLDGIYHFVIGEHKDTAQIVSIKAAADLETSGDQSEHTGIEVIPSPIAEG